MKRSRQDGRKEAVGADPCHDDASSQSESHATVLPERAIELVRLFVCFFTYGQRGHFSGTVVARVRAA